MPRRLLVLGFAAMTVICASQAVPAQTPAQSQSAIQLSSAQLEQLAAPVALYPDALLGQVLMASTYPLEVVEAARWSKEHPGVSDKALTDAMAAQSWDPSVKALASVPQTLQMMSDKLDWTQQLGDAFLAQQQPLLDAVQRLRQRAEAAGHLKSTPEQRVTSAGAPRTGGSAQPTTPTQQAIMIEPAVPDEFNVPVYDPAVVYGDWPYPAYQPFYWYPPGFIASNVLSFAAGAAVGAAIWANVDWWRRDVTINVNRYNQFNRTNVANNVWRHDPAHRHGVPYANRQLTDRFGDRGKAAARESFRGRAEAGQRDLKNSARKGQLAKTTQARGAKDISRAKAAQAGRAKDIGRAKLAADRRAVGQKKIDRARFAGHNRDAARMRAGRRSFGMAGNGGRALHPGRPAFHGNLHPGGFRSGGFHRGGFRRR